MKNSYQNYLSLLIWIVSIVLIGSLIGSLTKNEINTWYSTLNRSTITPPNYLFPIAWTFLYTLIATCGWIIWRTPWFDGLQLTKILYTTQLILNWSWTPLFFHYHLTEYSLMSLLLMDIVVSTIIYSVYSKLRLVSLFMIPYLLWLVFATYLNFYIWQYN